MRLGFGLVLLAVALGACGEDKVARLAADWGCGPVEGIKAISGEKAPAWILVGEMTETAEAPAAITDIACNLAASGERLFVGVQDYFGGATDAELKMIAGLHALAKKGAPVVVSLIGGEDHPYAVHDKSKAEKAWARALTEKVAAAGATHALLFVSRADAIAQAIPPSGERFAGYSPMGVFLEGGVVSLEVAGNPIPGAPGPAIRIHPQMQDGFTGQLALASLTRPLVAPSRAGDISGDPERVGAAQLQELATKAAREATIETMARDAAERLNGQYAPAPPISGEERERLLREQIERLQKTPE
jgi:hypothetical protein